MLENSMDWSVWIISHRLPITSFRFDQPRFSFQMSFLYWYFKDLNNTFKFCLKGFNCSQIPTIRSRYRFLTSLSTGVKPSARQVIEGCSFWLFAIYFIWFIPTQPLMVSAGCPFRQAKSCIVKNWKLSPLSFIFTLLVGWSSHVREMAKFAGWMQ